MPPQARDPYQVLGVAPGATDAEVRAAYRRLVQLHHPDHNGGSAESARRFEEVQEAYAKVRVLRAAGPHPGTEAPSRTQGPRPRGPARAGADPDLDARLAKMESELRQARERAQRAARQAAAEAEQRERPSDEELGYIRTDDSFSKIFDDAGAELSKLLRDLREQHSSRDD
jgi:curved DNA-binding protein CbpA